MKKTAGVYCLFLVVGMLLFGDTELSAQGAGTIFGRVSDSSGALVPAATITIIQQGTNQKRTLTTDEQGRYQAPLLPIGEYTVSAAMSGFRETKLQSVMLEIQGNREVNFILVLASQAESLTVSAAPVEVERASASLGQVIHERQVMDLPLNGRNFVQLGTLIPGAVKGEGAAWNNKGTEVSIRGSVSISVQGMRENDNDWLLDGVDNNELTAGTVAIMPSIDAIAEFKVLTYNYSAEYGSRAGGTIIVSTKNGTNAFHGTAFEFLRNDALDARNFFDGTTKPKYRQNQFGVSLGGPIRKDKSFFFGDWQGTRIRQGLTYLSTVPTDRMRAGNFDESFPNAPRRIIYDPATTRQDAVTGQYVRDAFPNNIIPSDRLDPIGSKLLGLYPLPNLTDRLSGNFLYNPIMRFSNDPFDVRVDQILSNNDALFVRFSYDAASEFQPGGLPGLGTGPGVGSTLNFHTDARNVAISETHTFSPTAINQLTLGFNRVFNRMQGVGTSPQYANTPQKIGIPGANLGDPVTWGMSAIIISGGYNGLGDRVYTPFVGGTNVWHFADSLNRVVGAHTLKMGLSARLMQLNSLSIARPAGSYSFDGLFTAGFTQGSLNGTTGSPIASILMGLPASGTHDYFFNGYMIGRRWKEFRGFFEDAWRVSPNLTLNVGLAYAVATPQTEAGNRFTNFDFATGQFLVAGKNGVSASGNVNTAWMGLQPRLGFAWSPHGSRKTSIRGGYGIFGDVSDEGGIPGLYQNPPNAYGYAFTGDNTNIPSTRALSQGFAPVSAAPPFANYRGNLYLAQLDFVQGMVQQWNVNVQREIPGAIVLTVAYGGTRGSHLQTKGFNLNTATPGPGNNPASRRPYPQFTNINAILSRGTVRYDSLQVKAEKRLSHGLYSLLSYTYAKSITNGPAQTLGNGMGIKYFPLSQSIVPKNSDKGLADTDLRHNVTLSWIYNLPFGRDRAFLRNASKPAQTILGNWQLNGITRLRSGFPLMMFMSTNQSGTQFGNRPNRICDGALPNPTPTKFFDTSCFVAPPVGVLGNSARTVLSGPGQVNFDFSIFKTIPIRESMDVQFRTEFFNILNTAQFDQPGVAAGSATFGQVQATINTARLIQFALKLRF